MRWKLAIAFCLVAVAVAADDHPLSVPPIGPSWRGTYIPAIAPLGNGFLTVWSEGVSGQYRLRAMRVDAAGKPVDSVSLTIAKPGLPNFLLAGTGNEVFVAWPSGYDPTFGFSFYSITRIDATGAVTQLQTPSFDQVVALAAGGDDILVVTAAANTIRVTLLDDQGALIRANVPIAYGAGQVGNIDASPTADGFLIVYTDNADGRVRVLHASTSAIRDGSIAPIVDQATTNQTAQYVHVAVNGAHALAIWTDGQVTRVRPLSSDGTPATSAPADLGAFSPVSSIAPYGDGFLATLFQWNPGSGYDLVVARLSANGDVVSLARAQTSGSYVAASAAASGSSAVVVWVFQGQTVAAPLLDGVLGASNVVSLAPAGDQHVQALFATASGAVAVWSEAGPLQRVVVGRIDAAGAPLDGEGFRLHDSLAAQESIGAAFNGDDLLVVWVERTGYPSVASLYATVVPPAAPLPARVIHVSDDVAANDPLDNVAASWDGREWVIVWQDKSHELAAMHLDPAGNPIEALPVPLTSAPSVPYVADRSPRISWNGSDYLLVWQRHRYYFAPSPIGEVPPEDAGDIAARRFTRDLVPDGPPIDVALASGDLTNNPVDAHSPDVAFSNGVWLIAWTTIDYNNTVPNGSFFARIDASGARLDPLNGRLLMIDTFPAHVAAAADGWIAGVDRTLVTISGDRVTTRESLPPGPIEAVAVRGPFPILAYTVSTDETLAWIHVVAERRRALH